jgi:DNA-3-methyladenine glycosylase I
VLKKRENYRVALDGFDIERIARYDEQDVTRLMNNPGIVRNQAKIRATIGNAAAWITLRQTQGNVVRFLWSFTGNKPFVRSPSSLAEVPASTAESDAMSSALRKAGFKFVGSTICYAFMQAAGMVNDHTQDCFCHRQP